jgi:hypothetical protein
MFVERMLTFLRVVRQAQCCSSSSRSRVYSRGSTVLSEGLFVKVEANPCLERLHN